MVKLRRNLRQGLQRQRAPGVSDSSDIDQVLNDLRLPDCALVEKLNTFLLYQDWFRKKDVVKSAMEIGEGARRFMAGGEAKRHHRQFGLFRSDLLAQLIRENDHKQRYLGFDTFVHMSSGLPRNLMIILKNVFRWSIFEGEAPFSAQPISRKAQRDGVHQSANWFYEDAPGEGNIGRDAQEAIERLAELMRRLRFADKPVESSLCTFSVDYAAISDGARGTIRAAEQWSMLIPIETGQRDRNTGAVLHKYQLSGMLAPRWDLPVFRRGVLELRPEEANAVFDVGYRPEYDGVVARRLGRLTAPFFRVPEERNEHVERTLFQPEPS
jgi:hypothetical protein